MKKKRWMILLGVVIVVGGAGLFGARLAWRTIHGGARLTGRTIAIPEPVRVAEPVRLGQADWPGWRGPAGDGRSSVTGIRTDWSQGLEQLWEVNFLCQGHESVTWSAPAVQGNRLVVPGRDEDNDLVFCLDPQTGALIWIGRYEAQTDSNHGGGPRATPYIDGDRVYTFGRSGDLVCWDLHDGRLLWRRNVREVGGENPTWGHSSSPMVYGDWVVVQGGGEALVVAYDKMTGEPVWTSLQGRAGYATPILYEIGDHQALLVFHGEGLSALDPGTGSELWSVPWRTPYKVNATTPVVSGDLLFITSGYRTGCQVLQVQQEQASELWRSNVIASHHSDPILIDGFLYGYSGQSHQNRGTFKCVELATGQERWATSEMGWGTTVWVDGYLLCMDIKGNLFLVEPNPDAWHKVAEFRGALGRVSHHAWTIPVVANGRLYLRYMQRMVCYNLMP